MNLKDFKDWVNKIPEEYDEFNIVNDEGQLGIPLLSFSIDEDKKEFIFENSLPENEYVYASIYNEDSFVGIKTPITMNELLVYLNKNVEYSIDEIFYDLDSYRDYEVEVSSQAKDGSSGTEDINNVDELLKYFSWNTKIVEDIKKYINDEYEKFE